MPTQRIINLREEALHNTAPALPARRCAIYMCADGRIMAHEWLLPAGTLPGARRRAARHDVGDWRRSRSLTTELRPPESGEEKAFLDMAAVGSSSCGHGLPHGGGL